MILFLDGPAAGKSLNLARAPYFLRVVIGPGCAVDALDQLDDEPKPEEAVYVYRLDGPSRRGIACSRGKGCKPFSIAEYCFHIHNQPSEAVVRDNAAWGEWAESEYARRADWSTADEGAGQP